MSVKNIRIRLAAAKDTNELVLLLKELGYPNSGDAVRKRLKKLTRNRQDTILVAESKAKVLGMGHLHVADLFHQKGKLGRVMALVVANKYGRRGIGRKLMARLEAKARRAGCVKMEVTSGWHRDDAHKFYLGLGYHEKPKRFIKEL